MSFAYWVTSQNTLILCFPRLFLYQDKSQFCRKKLLKYILPSRKTNICLPFQNHGIRTCSVDQPFTSTWRYEWICKKKNSSSGPARWTIKLLELSKTNIVHLFKPRYQDLPSGPALPSWELAASGRSWRPSRASLESRKQLLKCQNIM